MKVVFKQKQHDYPKRVGDLNLAWYAGGQICIARKKTERSRQKQNESIIRINAICKGLWDGLDLHFKQDLSRYAFMYKQEYPSLRKRGVSSYAVFLMIIHALIKRFSLRTDDQENCMKLLKTLLGNMSVYKAVQYRLIKVVSKSYQLNKYPYLGYQQSQNKESADLDKNNAFSLKKNEFTFEGRCHLKKFVIP